MDPTFLTSLILPVGIVKDDVASAETWGRSFLELVGWLAEFSAESRPGVSERVEDRCDSHLVWADGSTTSLAISFWSLLQMAVSRYPSSIHS